MSSIHIGFRVRTESVTCPRWLCAPAELMAFEHGQSVVTGTTAVAVKSSFPFSSVALKRTV